MVALRRLPIMRLTGQPDRTESPHLCFPAQLATPADVNGVLAQLEPVGLGQITELALQDRLDTKFVLDGDRLSEALPALALSYYVLEIDNVRLHRYQTLYFDTPNFSFYEAHHARRLNRYKVRARRYVDTRQSFLEIKRKTKNAFTVKTRVATPELVVQLADESADFLRRNLAQEPAALEPKLWNAFRRITLIARDYSERLTIDLDIAFRGVDGDVALPRLVVAEVKQAGFNANSEFVRLMRSLRVRPADFSKYCVGVALTTAGIKRNRFKPALRLVEQITGGQFDA
jgi:hypothetical protein